MAHVDVLQHQGKTIVRTTFPKEADLAGIQAVLDEVSAIYRTLPAGSILALVKFEDRDFEKPVIDLIERVAKGNEKLVKATAFHGVNGLQKVLFKAMIAITGRKAQLFNTEAEGLDWLAKVEVDQDPMAGLF